MAAVAFTYDGGDTAGSVITATVTGATPGQNLALDAEAMSVNAGSATADGSGNASLTATFRFNADDGTPFATFVYDSDTGQPLGATMFNVADSRLKTNPAGSSAVWDHTTGDFSATFTPYGGGQDTYIWDWWDSLYTDDPTGSVATLSGTINLITAPDGDLVFLETDDPTFGYCVTAVWWMQAGADTVYAPAPPGLTANFSGAPLSVFPGEPVHFHDLSTPGPSGPITAWDYDFGDGTTHGSTPNPTHAYATPGTYSVTLTVTGTGPDGTDAFTRTAYVVVLTPGSASPHLYVAPAHGCPGDTVSLTGYGFASSSALTATFDGGALTFTPSTSDASGNFSSTFVVPNDNGSGLPVDVTDASTNTGSTTFDIDARALSLSPATAGPGDTVTVSGSCWCPGNALTGTWEEGTFLLPGYFSRSLVFTPPDVAIDGTVNSTFVVPEDARPGNVATVRIGDGCGPNSTVSFTVCGRPGGDYDWYATPTLRPSTDTEAVPTGELLDWTDTATDFWLLFHRPSSDWSGSTFPPPDDSTTYPLEVHQIPKDGSPLTVYPCGTDLKMHWDFASDSSIKTVGCFPPLGNCTDGGIGCTPGKTGYWYRAAWWFTGWRKRVVNARLASDGTNVWVAAIATETEAYPHISTADAESDGSGACPTGCTMDIPSQSSQFIDLATVTSGFTTFVTDEATALIGDMNQPCGSTLANFSDYQKWVTQGNGPLGLSPRRGNESDGGDNWTGHYQQPKLVLFALGGGAFTRIDDDPSQFIMGFGLNFYEAGNHAGGSVGGALETCFGWLSLAASSAEPGVCHAVWSEQGAYGTRYKGGSIGPSSAFSVWDAGAEEIGARVSYSKWSAGALSSQTDLWTGAQARNTWFFVSDPFYVTGDFSSGPPPGMNYSDQFEVKNEHGSPALILAFESLDAHDIGNDPGVDSGTSYQRLGSDVSTLSYYDLSSGAAVLAQLFDTALLPTQADLQNVFTVNGDDPSPITHGPEHIEVAPYAGPGLVFQDAISTTGLNTSRKYHDPTLAGGTDVYVVSVETVDRWIGTSTPSVTASYYRISCDGATAWDYVQGDRDLAISPTITRWGTTVGVSPAAPYAWYGLDFACHAQGVWGRSGASFPNDAWERLDFVCDRWWEALWFQADQIPTYQGSSLVPTHGSPIFDAAAGVILYPGKHSTSSSTHVFGIISTSIVPLSCACASQGLHIWQRF